MNHDLYRALSDAIQATTWINRAAFSDEHNLTGQPDLAAAEKNLATALQHLSTYRATINKEAA